MQKFVKFVAMMMCSVAGLGMAGTASANPTILMNDSNGNIVSYDTVTRASTVLGDTGMVMTDIALNTGGDLYGVDGNSLFRIAPTTGATTMLGSLGAFVNGLVFGPDGTLFGSGGNGLFRIDTNTGAASLIGSMGARSSGDLAFFKGQMYLGSNLGLAVVDPTSGATRLIGGTLDLYGLASTADTLFGVKGTTIYNIDPNTGLGVSVGSYSGAGAYGAASVPVSVPEPATWAMMALGLVLVGGVVRRRRALPRAMMA